MATPLYPSLSSDTAQYLCGYSGMEVISAGRSFSAHLVSWRHKTSGASSRTHWEQVSVLEWITAVVGFYFWCKLTSRPPFFTHALSPSTFQDVIFMLALRPSLLVILSGGSSYRMGASGSLVFFVFLAEAVIKDQKRFSRKETMKPSSRFGTNQSRSHSRRLQPPPPPPSFLASSWKWI